MVDAIELLDAVQLVGLGPTGSPRTPDRVDVREAPLRLRADQALGMGASVRYGRGRRPDHHS
jgi:hypothetical protein